MNTSKSRVKNRQQRKENFPVIGVAEVPEISFLDHTSEIDPSRTRDYRYYRKEFGANGFGVAYIPSGKHLVNVDNLEDIIINTRCRSFTIGSPMGGNNQKNGLLRHNLGQIDRLNAIARKYPHVLVIGVWGESETHSYREIPPSATPQEAYGHYRKMMLMDPAYNKNKRKAVEKLIIENPDATIRDALDVIFDVTFDPAIELHSCPDKVYGIHPHFALGIDLVHMERSGWNCNCNIAISFLRGGAHEYGKKWGLNMSPWGNSHSYARAGTAYDGNNRHVAGNSAELHWFNNMSALLAGAHEICHAGNETMFFRLPEPTLFGPSNCDHGATDCGRLQDPGEFGAHLTPAGEYAKRLHQLIDDSSFERGKPIVPAALMVELSHGWDAHHFACEDWAWGGKVPVHRGDRMMSALFELFFPGQALSGRAHDWAYNPDVPFESEFEMMKMLYAGMDMRKFEKGIFTATPLGDSFDVVTDHIKPKILKEYSITILTGRLSLTPENLPHLRSYVEKGGTLVLHGMGLGLWEGGTELKLPKGYQKKVESLIGCSITSLFSVGYFPSVNCSTGERFREGKYEYTLVEPTTAIPLVEGEEIYERINRERHEQASQTVASGKSIGHPRQNKELNKIMREQRENYRYKVGDGTPIVTENKIGAGRVIFCAPHHHLTAQGKQLINGVRDVLIRLVDSFVPVKVHGRPVQFHINRIEHGYLIGLFNWSEHVWSGNVELRGVKTIHRVNELLNNDEDGFRPVIHRNIFNATVKPYEIGLFKVQV